MVVLRLNEYSCFVLDQNDVDAQFESFNSPDLQQEASGFGPFEGKG
jgi:hypothetical protein